MSIKRIITTIQEQQPQAVIEPVEKAHELLQSMLNSCPAAERRTVYEQALYRAKEAIDHHSQLELISAALLFDLPQSASTNGFYQTIHNHLGEEVFFLVRSYHLAKEKLIDQQRFNHSYRTALKVASIKIGVRAICAALLHELPAHTPVSIEEIEQGIDQEIANLVKNFQNLRVIKTPNSQHYVAQLREMVVAMAADLRVIIIKMCSNIDRLQHVRETDQEKLNNLALESRDILAPIADLLGIWDLRWQLEDHAFKILAPEEYEKISRRFNVDEKKNRDKYIQKTKNILQKAASDVGLVCQMDGRFKHFYSIYTKMKAKKKSFDEICDVFALRVIVNSVDECYRLLGIIHRLWRPRHRRIKDYIAMPKNNRYQSLHTTVFGLNGRPTEFQIRTKEMDEEANYGIAAHWYYKNLKRKVPAWIQELLAKQQQYKNDEEFLSKFSSEILGNRIYVYTPKGDVIALPSGATPIDFAYHIHTEIGHKCSGAVINDIPTKLDQALNSNDVVQIILDREQNGPRPEWLPWVKTSAARKHIEEYLNKREVERRFRL